MSCGVLGEAQSGQDGERGEEAGGAAGQAGRAVQGGHGREGAVEGGGRPHAETSGRRRQTHQWPLLREREVPVPSLTISNTFFSAICFYFWRRFWLNS